MANNKIVLDVELKTKIKEGQNLFKTIDERKGFSSKDGAEAKNRIIGNQTVIDKFIDKIDLTEEEFAQLSKAARALFKDLSTYAARTEGLSEKALSLAKKLEEEEERQEKARTKVSDKRDDITNKRIALTDALKGKELHSFNKDGSLSKAKIGADVIARRLGAGETLGYTNEKGEIQKLNLNTDNAVAQAALELNQANTELSNLKQELEECALAVKNAKEAFNTQASQEGGVLTSTVKETGSDVSSGLNNT